MERIADEKDRKMSEALVKMAADVVDMPGYLRQLAAEHSVEIQGKGGVRVHVLPAHVAQYIQKHAPGSVIGAASRLRPLEHYLA
jgi:hypothetical protein